MPFSRCKWNSSGFCLVGCLLLVAGVVWPKSSPALLIEKKDGPPTQEIFGGGGGGATPPPGDDSDLPPTKSKS